MNSLSKRKTQQAGEINKNLVNKKEVGGVPRQNVHAKPSRILHERGRDTADPWCVRLHLCWLGDSLALTRSI